MDEAHVTAQVNNEVDGAGNAIYRAITFISPGLLEVGGGAAGVGEPIVFRRTTPIQTTINKFAGASAFSAAAVDQSFQQVLFGVQEAQDQLEGTKDLEQAVSAAAGSQVIATAAAAEAVAAAGSIEPYENRATAVAATVDGSVSRIAVLTPHGMILRYVETVVADRRIALTTNGGTRYWEPGDTFISPQHYGENTTPGTTNMIAALDAMTAAVAHTPLIGVAYPNTAALYYGAKFSAPTRVDFLGERVSIDRPWVIGALDVDHDGVFDTGPGAVYGMHISNGRLDVLDTFDASALATHTHPTEGLVTTVPGYAMVIGTYELTDKQVAQSNLFYVDGVTVADSFEIDCAFQTGGIYPINTNRTTIGAAHIFNLGQGTWGITTAVSDKILTPNHIGNFNPQVGAPFPAGGAQCKNPELRIERVSISGRNRQAGVAFPGGLTDLDMNTTAIGIYTADFHLIDPLITATSVSIEFDMFHNGQFSGGHPWANSIIYGPDCANVQTENGYWDTTDVVMYSFNHILDGCSFGAGSKNLRLVATQAGEDADGLVITGGRLYNSATIVYATEGSGSWLAANQRKCTILMYSEQDDIDALQLSNKLRVDGDGILHMSRDGTTGAYMGTSVEGEFLIVPYSGGVSKEQDQIRFDTTHDAWRIGSPFSTGKGYIMTAPNGTDYKVTMGNGGVFVIAAL